MAGQVLFPVVLILISVFILGDLCKALNPIRSIIQWQHTSKQLPVCRGPHENYIDRQDGALVRWYASDISTLHTPYIAPSENGGRGAVRWMALLPPEEPSQRTPNRCPIIVAASHPVAPRDGSQPWPAEDGAAAKTSGERSVFHARDCLHFSASYHSTEDLFAAKHDHELPKGGSCYLHLDGMHMGVGGDDSWTPSVCPRLREASRKLLFFSK